MRAPIFLIHGTKDAVVPVRHSGIIAQVLQITNKFHFDGWYPAAGHNNIEILFHSEYYIKIREFLSFLKNSFAEYQSPQHYFEITQGKKNRPELISMDENIS